MAESSEAATQPIVRTDLDELFERSRRPMLPEPEPVGECPYCHFALERRIVRQEADLMSTPLGGRAFATALLQFWGCTNEHCRLMFWRMPESIPETH